jgi:hypothetical protein
VDEMLQRSIPVIAPTTRTIALSLLVAVVLIMTLVVQLAARPAPGPPAPKPPLQFGGGSAGRPMPF